MAENTQLLFVDTPAIFGLDIKPNSAKDLANGLNLGQKYGLIAGTIIEKFREEIDKNQANLKRSFFYLVMSKDLKQYQAKIVLQEDTSQIPIAKDDTKFHEYIAKYKMPYMYPIFVTLAGTGEFWASMICLPWRMEDMINDMKTVKK